MATDSTLHAMSQYDFSRPIDVTITLDDSDMENDPHDSIKPNVQEEYVEQTNFSISPTECLSKSYKLPSNPIIDLPETASVNINNRIYNLNETDTTPYVNNNVCQGEIAHVTVTNVENLSNQDLHLRALKEYVQNSTSCNKNATSRSVHTKNNKGRKPENRITSYIKKLLNAVSENLLAILKAYRGYLLIQNNPASTKAVIENSWHYFLCTKYHFFKLSYSTVMTLFLPEHKIGNFDEHFLKDTLRISESVGIYCTYSELKRVYFEMMHWLVTNKEKLNFVPLRNVAEYSKQQEQRKPISSNMNSRATQKRPLPPPYREPKFRKIFSSGPPGREVLINVNQSYLQSYPNVSNASASTNLTQSDQNIYVASQSGYESTVNNYYHQSTHSNELNSSISIQNNNLIQNHSNATISGTTYWPPTNYTSQRVPENYEIQITNVRTERPTHIYPEENRRKSITDPTNIRSSDSRDSGIISPLNFNFTNEQTYNNNNENNYYWEPQVTTSLPDITSLNPNGSLIVTSMCHTCGKNTNTKCIRCYKTYYCSLLCLTLDWSSHINVCKSIEETQSTFA